MSGHGLVMRWKILVKMSWGCKAVSVVLFVFNLNMKISGLKGYQFGKLPCWRSLYLFVCSKEKKRG